MMDVETLQTNIDHSKALRHYLQSREEGLMPLSHFILQLTHLDTLYNNLFLFQDEFFQQIKGTAMGACYASSYAHLFLLYWEERFVHSSVNPFQDYMLFYGRYIDTSHICSNTEYKTILNN